MANFCYTLDESFPICSCCKENHGPGMNVGKPPYIRICKWCINKMHDEMRDNVK